MRAKQVNEFRQGGDPMDIMGIGYAGRVKAWFKKWQPDWKQYTIKDDNTVTVHGRVVFREYPNIDSIIPGLIIKRDGPFAGSLEISNTNIKTLPDNLIIDDYLELSPEQKKVINIPLGVDKAKIRIIEDES
jgi:hypothetical protein